MSEAQAGDADRASPGATLAAAREALGLSVAEVAAQMRLSPRQVEALEADRHGELPGAVFVRGFLRNYARILRLDPQPLLAAIEPARSHVAQVGGRLAAREIPFPAHRRRWLPYAVLGILVVGAAAVYEQWFARTGQSVSPAAIPQAPAKPAVDSSPPPPAAPATAGGENSGPVAVPAEAKPAETRPAPAEDARAQVRLRFAGESWVEVRSAAGEVTHLRTHRAGEELELGLERGSALVVGNATAVRMTYNGAPFDLAPHMRVGVARFTLE